jgi:translation initiation factor 2-alpha kinase 3
MFRSPNDPSSSADSSDADHAIKDGMSKSESSPTGVQGFGLTFDGRPNSSTHVSPATFTRVPSTLISSQRPNIALHQQHGMLYVSFIHDTCKKKALKQLNERRDSDNMLSEDDEEVKKLAADIFNDMSPMFSNIDLPEEVKSGSQGAEARAGYLDAFENAIENRAAVRVSGIEQSMQTTNLAQTTMSDKTIADPRTFMAHQQMTFNPPARTETSQLLTLGERQNAFSATPSVYLNEYQELELLGRGGYGQVYKALNKLDNQEYAIKKIRITSHRLQKSLGEDQAKALLGEIRTLAKLSHTNIVRYFHAWVETAPASTTEASGTSRLVEALNTISSDLSSSEEGTGRDISRYNNTYSRRSCTYSDGFQPYELTSGIDFGGNQAMEQLFEEALDREDLDNIVFGNSSRSHPASPVRNRDRRESAATISSTRTFKTSVLSVGENDFDDDPEIETIPRAPILDRASLSHTGRTSLQASQFLPESVEGGEQYSGPDITLFIKMSLHPTTLAAYLSPGEGDIHHCFHKDASVGILLSILDGIEYLHNKRIVHRDLKPANIFLSVHHDHAPSLEGCVDIKNCSQCEKVDNDKRVYITPCIGDFGLNAEIQEPLTVENNSQPTFQPSRLATLQPKPVGTQFYRPPTMPKNEPVVCEKLDVYSLGVMAFELNYKFGTKSERATVLTLVNKGLLPKDFGDDEMAAGIRAMTCEDRSERWDCAAVREWLTKLQRGVARPAV